VGSGDDDGAGSGDEFLVDVVGRERHVGAVLAIEDQRKGSFVADAEDRESGQPFPVDDHARRLHSLRRELLHDEAAHVLVPDAGHERRTQTQPRRSHRDVGGAAADVFRETRHILQPAADLLAVQVDRGASDRDDVETGRRFVSVSHQAPPLVVV